MASAAAPSELLDHCQTRRPLRVSLSNLSARARRVDLSPYLRRCVRFGTNLSDDDSTPHGVGKGAKPSTKSRSLSGEHFHTWRIRHLVAWADFVFVTPLSKVISPLKTAANGPNGAISLTQTFNRISFYFCNRKHFGVQKAKTGIGEQSCIPQS